MLTITIKLLGEFKPMTKILIAEHNQSVATYIKAALKKTGKQFFHTDSSLEAWRATSKMDFDVLIVDIIMPGMDGFVLAQKALQENPGIQVIFITGFAAVAMDTYNTPAYSPRPMTSKPFHIKDIANRVSYLIGESDLLTSTSAQYYQGNTNEGNIVYAEFGKDKKASAK